METVRIGRIEYEVEFAKSPADLEADGRPAVAAMLRADGVSRQLVLRRPRGSRRYLAREVIVRLARSGRELGRHYSTPVAL